MQPTEPEIGVKVFISYARADQELRKKLEDHLSSLRYSEQITVWQDEEIPAGANREDEINNHLNEADLILLLISPSFMASKDTWDKEVQTALERYKAGTAWAIPIILKPVNWKNTPLGELQPLPTDAKPVTQWNDLDAALEDVAQGIQKVVEQLQASGRKKLPQSTPLDYLAQQMRTWFQTLNYSFERYEKWSYDCFEWIINIPHRRRYDRILIHGVDGEAKVHHVDEMRTAVEEHRGDEGWIVAVRRVSQAARREVEHDKIVSCYTFDELLDLNADFSQYLDYLAKEIQGRKIDTTYVPLACSKDEFNPATKKKVATSVYNESNGWIEGYIDRWLMDPSKEHISVLGEFGTGKTWFTLHYAWVTMQRYLDARERGIERPRLPLVIPLRDYAKAVSVESLFSEFFFRKYEIDLPGYSVFELLNRMGKLLLIFDGFDEMADKVDRQKMINNFWELARTVVPGSKVILTCRTEHFPHAKEGRALLNAELQASTASLTGEPPQFEVLELQQFDDDQIQTLLSFHTTPDIAQKVMNNAALVDLARRPVMTDLILEALPDIEAGKPVDMSRVYLYAVQRKMERDISNARTFTSLKDKLYFLCELSCEMISTDQMSLNYRLFPDHIRKLFGPRVEEQKDLDHWHYDMMGQTMLIRNADGDYSPAHRSLLEFFVAYKIAAELGVLDPDFITLAQPHEPTELREYTWSDYFCYQASDKKDENPSVSCFLPETLEHMRETVGKTEIAEAVLDLMQNMLISDWEVVKEKLINIILQTRGKTNEEVGLIGANVAAILLHSDREVFVGRDLSGTNLAFAEFERIDLTACNLSGANLEHCEFVDTVMGQADLRDADLTGASFRENNVLNCVAISPDGSSIATGGRDGSLDIWDTKTGGHLFSSSYRFEGIVDVFFSPEGIYIGDTGNDEIVQIYDLEKKQVSHRIHIEAAVLSLFLHKSNLALSHVDGNITIWDLSTNPTSLIEKFFAGDQEAYSIIFHSQMHSYIAGNENGLITLWDVEKKEISLQKQCASSIYELCLSPDETLLAVGGLGDGLLLLHAHDLSEIWHLKDISRVFNPVFTSTGEWIFAGCGNVGVIAVLARSGINVTTFPAHSQREVAISPDDTFLVSVSDEKGTIQFWDIRPFVTIADEPHIPLADYNSTDLSSFFEDSTTWPEWWHKCELPIPTGRIPNPNFGKCLRTIQYHSMNYQGLRLLGTKGLDTVKIKDSKGKSITQKVAWFTEHGAIRKEQSSTRKSRRTKKGAGE